MDEIYYHTDRQYGSIGVTQLAVGMSIDLSQLDETTPGLTLLYPGGLSEHGKRYLLQANRNRDWEWACELTRRGAFPAKPSRFQSMFGCEDDETARRIVYDYFSPERTNYSGGKVALWKVTCSGSVHRGDMRWFENETTSQISYQMMFDAMVAYWQGKAKNRDPLWEIVLPLPVSIVAMEDVLYREVRWISIPPVQR